MKKNKETVAQKIAARRAYAKAREEKGRQLTREDPVPQTIYRVMAPDGKGMLINLLLKYGK